MNTANVSDTENIGEYVSMPKGMCSERLKSSYRIDNMAFRKILSFNNANFMLTIEHLLN